jgi:hypothetical protein
MDGCYNESHVKLQLQLMAKQPDKAEVAKQNAGLRVLEKNNWRSPEYWQKKGRE